ncbi:MAG: kinase [Gammaproteobacteria bacterium]|nr:kinase [Gammaproteobacteria bacterium]
MKPNNDNCLLILRGPSGSGKTTVARKLFGIANRKVALIEQDYYRFIFNPAGSGSRQNSDVIHQMIEHNTSIALQSGYNVILEGILSVKSYAKVIDRIISSHSGKSYIFYFDISFEETIKRHSTKEGNYKYGEAEMREWYPAAHKSGHELENLIPEVFTIDQTVSHIIKISGYEHEYHEAEIQPARTADS